MGKLVDNQRFKACLPCVKFQEGTSEPTWSLSGAVVTSVPTLLMALIMKSATAFESLHDFQ